MDRLAVTMSVFFAHTGLRDHLTLEIARQKKPRVRFFVRRCVGLDRLSTWRLQLALGAILESSLPAFAGFRNGVSFDQRVARCHLAFASEQRLVSGPGPRGPRGRRQTPGPAGDSRIDGRARGRRQTPGPTADSGADGRLRGRRQNQGPTTDPGPTADLGADTLVEPCLGCLAS